jgi:hypothetical protein
MCPCYACSASLPDLLLVRAILQAAGDLKGIFETLRRSRHKLIVFLSVVSIAFVVTAYVMIRQSSTLSEDRITIVNTLANVGLGISVLPWLLAMFQAWRAKNFGAFFLVLVVGIGNYAAALIISDIFLYAAAGLIPLLFGLWESRAADAKT